MFETYKKHRSTYKKLKRVARLSRIGWLGGPKVRILLALIMITIPALISVLIAAVVVLFMAGGLITIIEYDENLSFDDFKVTKEESPVAGGGNKGDREFGEDTGGLLMKPTDGTLSSPYGPRIHPVTGEVGKLHAGLDIAGPSGTKIYAAESGEVRMSGWIGGYGNAVVIRHNINGQIVDTLYAHMRDPSDLIVGEDVERGQYIGPMGTTGVSTGVHLHFEVLVGGYTGVYGVNSVDPKKWIDF